MAETLVLLQLFVCVAMLLTVPGWLRGNVKNCKHLLLLLLNTLEHSIEERIRITDELVTYAIQSDSSAASKE